MCWSIRPPPTCRARAWCPNGSRRNSATSRSARWTGAASWCGNGAKRPPAARPSSTTTGGGWPTGTPWCWPTCCTRSPGFTLPNLLDDVIYEVTPKGDIAWRWIASDHLDELGFTPEQLKLVKASKSPDYFHLNNMTPLGPNKWARAGDRRFDPDNILVDLAQTRQLHHHPRPQDRQGGLGARPQLRAGRAQLGGPPAGGPDQRPARRPPDRGRPARRGQSDRVRQPGRGRLPAGGAGGQQRLAGVGNRPDHPEDRLAIHRRRRQRPGRVDLLQLVHFQRTAAARRQYPDRRASG